MKSLVQKISGLVLAGCAAFTTLAADNKDEKEPPVITPGQHEAPPSDAVVLFDGKDLSAWKSDKGDAPNWKIENGYAEVHGGSIMTKEEFGSLQLHIEWATPSEVKGEGQGRGNSGVYLQGRYEIQVLDSYNNKTYFNGQAASFYGHNAPLVNASRKPGEWQTYDIVFHPPKPFEGGTANGSITVFHNGVLVQDHITVNGNPPSATTKGPILLQDHGNPVRYRNIWVRKLD
ncbi:MAG: DUF1080 domain-containing protein [Verrucomicrobia bacterium]|nr:DUF1080 domain-containing protein [Verrucomicrobiota bacterium]